MSALGRPAHRSAWKGGWIAARPSGTEDIYKFYAESFRDQSHLNAILAGAEEIVNNVLRAAKGQA